jgi:CRISPR-associated endonuclease/helicase Cas3
MYFAHSAATREGWEPLHDHLRDVAERAAAFAQLFGAEEEARLAGLLHDLGKYSERFTRRLEGLESGLDHWSAGAWAALTLGRAKGTAAALAIQGHHIGLQSPDELYGLRKPADYALRRGLDFTEADFPALLKRLAEDGLTPPGLDHSLFVLQDPQAAGMLDVRMLFSTLVDADFLETEAHFARDAEGRKVYRPEAPPLNPQEALNVLDAELARLARGSSAAPEVNRLRADLLAACREAGPRERGLFTLSAPTGAGKTLAMLAFALHHAQAYGLRRVVIAVPFLSIIEQTAGIYRNLFGDRYVLEHHSLAGTHGGDGNGKNADRSSSQPAENWDAPLVVTTTVQLLESLFANRPSACRKLHRLAGSVILLDEVQTLPLRLAVPTLATLSHLAARYGSSVVFATATQPAFDHLDTAVRPLAGSGWRPREIVDPGLDLFERARRTRVVWETASRRSWDSLADELSTAGTALCIVNLKRHAAALVSRLRERGVPGLFHLSTNLCPAHRQRVLSEVRRCLEHRRPCLLISTQCVEAGVDVDFPLVFRAFAPLDAIAQAAGRCNRNGLQPEPGLVRVFLPEDEAYPPGGYREATSIAGALLQERGPERMDLQDLDLFRRYYEDLYDQTKIAADPQGKARELAEALNCKDFAATAELYRLIDQDAVNVLVPYDPEAFQRLRTELRQIGKVTVSWTRQARAHAVSLYRPKRRLLGLSPAEGLSMGKSGKSLDWMILTDASLYDDALLGLTGIPETWIDEEKLQTRRE